MIANNVADSEEPVQPPVKLRNSKCCSNAGRTPGWKSHVPAHFLNEELKCIDVKTYANCYNGVQDIIRKIYQSSKR